MWNNRHPSTTSFIANVANAILEAAAARSELDVRASKLLYSSVKRLLANVEIIFCHLVSC